jgi:hypothetical protein
VSDEGWEERMSARHKKGAADDIAPRRRAYLGDVFLEFWPPDAGCGFEPEAEILPQIIAARCLGIEYGDPGPPLGGEWCRDCWGERHVWLGNCWGLQHAGGTINGCQHTCHVGQVWLASAG